MNTDDVAVTPDDDAPRGIIEQELHGALKLLSRGLSPGPMSEFLLVMELLRRLKAGSRILLEHDAAVAGTVSGAANVVERHLVRETKDLDEYNYLLLGVIKKLLEVASVDIESKYHARKAAG